MGIYPTLYRLGIRPWERYAREAGPAIAAVLDRDRASRPDPPGRALDVGCGRGLHTPRLAERGWETVGVDLVPSAIEHARRADASGATYQVADVTRLPASLGRFDLMLDVGCFQTLGAEQQVAAATSLTALANSGATLLLLAFGPAWFAAEGVSRAQVETAFEGWTLHSVEPAPTAGLGFPLRYTRPAWYRLQLAA